MADKLVYEVTTRVKPIKDAIGDKKVWQATLLLNPNLQLEQL